MPAPNDEFVAFMSSLPPAELRSQLTVLHRESFVWALHCCRSSAARAEDVLQEAYLKILDGRARFSGQSSFKTWMFSLIRFTALDDWRHFTRHDARQTSLDEAPEPVAEPIDT